MKNRIENFNCPVGVTLSIIGGKYKAVIVWYLYKESVLRYGELQKILKDVTPKMLIAQLRELEADGIIERRVYPVVPPKVEYALADLGKTLVPILKKKKKWGEFYCDNLKKD